jgi:hypothetical protein
VVKVNSILKNTEKIRYIGKREMREDTLKMGSVSRFCYPEKSGKPRKTLYFSSCGEYL